MSSPTGNAAMLGKIIAEGITFDDVLILPRRSAVMPAEAQTDARFTRNLRLKIPLISAPMDTVTDAALAIALAQEGGIGIIHKNMPVEAQAREVAKVKRSANGIISDPITLRPTDTVGRARELMRQHNVSGFPITQDAPGVLRSKGKVLGILTRRDLKFVEDLNTPLSEVMTDKGLITAPPGTTLEQAEVIVNKNKVEKLLLVDGNFHLAGLITMRDIERLSQFPRACTDSRGRLSAAPPSVSISTTAPRPSSRPASMSSPSTRPTATAKTSSAPSARSSRSSKSKSSPGTSPPPRPPADLIEGRRRRDQGRHRPRLHLHHPHRHRRGRAPDHRRLQRRRRARRLRSLRPRHRRRRRPQLRRHRQGHRRRRRLRHDGLPLRRPR
jgi:IMP dehydrogenase/GMP reductase